MRMQAHTTIELTPERVFELFADLERSTEYSAPVIERRQLTEGPLQAGTRFHAVDRWPGRTVEFEVEYTEYEPPTRLVASWTEPMPGGWSADLTPDGGGTLLTFEAEMRPSGVMGLLAPLLGFWARRQTRTFLADFKHWAEAQGAGGEAGEG
jgi:uncharacterized protein YndB with AHSA1/START domain